LKEVLNAKNAINIKLYAKSSQNTFNKQRHSTEFGKKTRDNNLDEYQLPEHAAQRWMNQSKY